MIYFDNAATTMKKPKEVIEAVTDALAGLGNAGRGVHGATLSASRIVFQARAMLAEFFHGENPARIVFTMNATESLNIAIKGVLSPGDHVITTALEHNSVLRPLYEMERQGVLLTILPVDEKGNICYEQLKREIRPETKAIVCTHGSNLTGNLINIERVGKIAKTQDILLIVDASQTAGLVPIDVQQMNIDILCFTGHKGLFGPQGTGGMYVREGIFVRPLLSGGSGVQTYSKEHPRQMPTALEAGTLNAHGLAGLLAGVNYICNIGQERIRRKEHRLMKQFYEGVREIPGIKIYGDFSVEERCAIVSLNVRDYDSSQVSDALFEQYGICTRPGAHCAPLLHEALGTVSQGAVRFSFSYFNTEEEVAYAIKALTELAAEE